MANDELTAALPERTDGLTVLTFLTSAAALSALWVAALTRTEFDVWRSNSSVLLYYYLSTVISVFPAVAVYTVLPSETVDNFHRIGKLFAMYLPINLALSVAFAYYNVVLAPSAVIVGGALEAAIAGVVTSSLFLPGPYAGAAVARWIDSRRG